MAVGRAISQLGHRNGGGPGPVRTRGWAHNGAELTRVYATISIASLVLAVLLTLYSWSPPAPGSFARAFAPASAPTPVSCTGLSLRGAALSGCLVIYQIECRPSAGTITANGQVGARAIGVQVTQSSVALSYERDGTRVVVQGGPPRTFDLATGASVDGDVGGPGTPDFTHAVGFISCGF